MRQDTRVPVEPFRAILNRRLKELHEQEIYVPTEALAREVGISARGINRILNIQKTIEFDTADRIVTALEGPTAWHERPSLNQVYRSVNFRRIDWSYPTCDSIAEKQTRVARKLAFRLGSVKLAAEYLGVSKTSLDRRLTDV